jgi:hypothetical protein
MSLRSANYVNVIELMSTGHTHDQDHAGETRKGHGRDHGEQAREEAHQPMGAAPDLQPQAVQAPSSRGARLKPRRRWAVGAASREVPLRPPRISLRS